MIKHDMLCTCSSDTLREAEEQRFSAMEDLQVSAKDLTKAILLSISWDFEADVYVDGDQWFRVTIQPKEGFSESIECDNPLDGLIFLWKRLQILTPTKVMLQGNQSEDAEAKDLSAKQFEALFPLRETLDSHKDACDCQETMTCPTYKQLVYDYRDLRFAIDDKWGIPNPEESLSFWGLEAGDLE